ncbi:FapA family protein [Bacillus sp. 31A1R]|uniref:FapA family protein n=1 Tax=Robertmurraya mangrovi TaxID=3098077 RepID=A0ABU5J273_9BACI|nr:FapA family protein [Bacillus sp. 31A1R]MDZ5473455.1 FapA family protein [Bacillus sp. 31A1R]
MELPFKVIIAKDRLTAQMELAQIPDESFSISMTALVEWLKKEQIVFGLNQDTLLQISQDPLILKKPLVVAKGIPAKNGEDAYIVAEIQEQNEVKKGKINFRNVMNILSVKIGQLIATITPATTGENGTDVSGRPILAKSGKPLRIKAGKNVILSDNQFISSIDGQVSITNQMITVNPVFEVKGDLDLKTGNINFIGNVVIKGNVPTGYEVRAGGDIKIHGLVEGATIAAEGNIMISGGVTGGNRGSVIAKGIIHAAYLNQANVQSDQDIIIDTSVLHSKVHAAGNIICKTGHVIGGSLISGKDVHIKELGNHLFTRTDIYLAHDPSIDENEKKLKNELISVSENLKKIDVLEAKLIEIGRLKGHFTPDQKEMIMKQRATKQHLLTQLEKLNNDMAVLEDERKEQLEAGLFIYDIVYPNTAIHFGRYSKILQQKHSYVKFHYLNGDIEFEPLG